MDWHALRRMIETWRAAHWPMVAGPDSARWIPKLSPFIPDVWPPDGGGLLTAYLGAYRHDPALADSVIDVAFWAEIHVDVRNREAMRCECITDRAVELGPRGVRPLDSYERWLVESEDDLDRSLVTLVATPLDEVHSPMLREYFRMWVALNPRDALFIQPRHATFFQWLGPAGTVERIAQHYYALREWFYEREHGTGAIVDPRQGLVLHVSGQAVPVTVQHFLLGRSPDCDLVLPGNGVSREHATITYGQGTFWLTDLGSSFGTFRDGEPVRDHAPLLDGTTITLGAHEIRCEVQRLAPAPMGSDEELTRV